MIHKIYCIRDAKAEAYLPPFFLPQHGMATRVFTDMCNDTTHQFGAHPEDYTLWHIGQYDDSTGILTPESPHLALGKGIDYVVFAPLELAQ